MPVTRHTPSLSLLHSGIEGQGRSARRRAHGRRAFLGGAAGVCVGLPFLESLPQRSAWGVGDAPRFAFFIGTCNGVVADRFWPSELGPLDALADDPNAASVLAPFSTHLLFVQGTSLPAGPTSDTHAQSYPQLFTGAPHDEGGGNRASSTAPSIDTLLAPLLNPGGTEPLALYSGMKGGYIDERLSFIDAGQIRPAQDNSYQVYLDLLRQADPMGDANDEGPAVVDELVARRKSVLDLVIAEAITLRDRSGIGQHDRQRMEQHLDALREIEVQLGTIGGPGAQELSCDTSALDVDAIAAVDGSQNRNGMVEVVARLQLELAAFAFACDLNRVGTLQHGDGQDNSVYDVPSNERGWRFHHISHRVQSDSAVGNDQLAVEAHAEIDRVRLETFLHGLEKFDAHGLLELSVVMWANQMSDGPSGSVRNIPTVIAGNPGGALVSGQHVDVAAGGSGGQRPNGDVLTTVARALGTELTIGTSDGPIDELLS
jgi:hypothetical protein